MRCGEEGANPGKSVLQGWQAQEAVSVLWSQLIMCAPMVNCLPTLVPLWMGEPVSSPSPMVISVFIFCFYNLLNLIFSGSKSYSSCISGDDETFWCLSPTKLDWVQCQIDKCPLQSIFSPLPSREGTLSMILHILLHSRDVKLCAITRFKNSN